MAKRRHIPGDKAPKNNNPLVELVVAGVQFTLLVIGIIGVASEIFRQGGLLTRLTGNLMRLEFATILFVVPLVAVTIFLGRYWFEVHFTKSSSAAFAELVMYSVMAIGAYHLVRYLFPGLW